MLESLRSDWTVMEVFLTERMLPAIEDVPIHCPVTMVSTREMERISMLTTPPEILALVEQKTFAANDLRIDLPLLVLDDIRDPGNLGTIIRTADWFGFEQILCSPTCVELTNPKVIQATMGSVFRMPIAYTDLESFLQASKASGRAIYGALLEGENLFKKEKSSDSIIVIGSESHGIRSAVLPFITHPITIPRAEGSVTESLNASMAAGIILAFFAMN